MTVVVNGRFLAARPTGLHRTARSLLAAAVAQGLATEVLAPPGVEDALVDRHVWGPPGRWGGHVWEQVSLPAAAGRRPVLSLANTAPIAGRHGIVMVHDLAPLVGPEWFVRSMQLYVRAVLTAARRAGTVLTVSEQVAGELADAGVDRDRIHTVRPAVDPSFAPAPPADVAAVRERLDLDDAPYLVVVGWSDPRKDLATAVSAHRAARGAVDHRLVLVGGRHPVFAEVDVPRDPPVRLAGYLSDADLRAVLTGAHALLFPSRYEGFGLPPLEAWTCGTAALVADRPALRESTEGRAVYLPPGDVDAWAGAIVTALRARPEAPAPPEWTWTDAARRLLDVLGARAGR